MILDTSAYSALRAGNSFVIDKISQAVCVTVPATVLGELEAGFQVGARYKENEQALRDFLEEPFVRMSPVTTSIAKSYGKIYARLRRAGTPIPTNDIWIAACALEERSPLLTGDRHYLQVKDLEVILFHPQ